MPFTFSGGKSPLSALPDSHTVRDASRLGALSRVALGVFALVLAGLWVTASQLTPDGSGLGTHRQLGLPPCSSRVLLNMRCPACGMTTSWAHLARGDLFRSAASNAGGCLLGLLALAIVPAAAWIAAKGSRPSEQSILCLAVGLVAVLAVTLVDWIARLAVQ